MKPGDLVTLGEGLTHVPVYSDGHPRIANAATWWEEGEVGVFIGDVVASTVWWPGLRGQPLAAVLLKGKTLRVVKSHLRIDGEGAVGKISHARPKKYLTPK